jgi:hypothetical protein
MNSNARCKACQAPIMWGESLQTGKGMPIDPIGVPDGNLWVDHYQNGIPVFQVAKSPDDVPSSVPVRYKSHFATCPNAAEFRKRR